MSITISITIT